MSMDDTQLPLQAVEEPIICSPYAEPGAHWCYDLATGVAVKEPRQRDAGFWCRARRRASDDWNYGTQRRRLPSWLSDRWADRPTFSLRLRLPPGGSQVPQLATMGCLFLYVALDYHSALQPHGRGSPSRRQKLVRIFFVRKLGLTSDTR